MHGGVPVLCIKVDGRCAEVIDPKPGLLRRGIVVLLDSEGYWDRATSVTLPAVPNDGRSEPLPLLGATEDSAVVSLTRSFYAGKL